MKTADLEAEHRAAVRNLKTEDALELVDQLEIPFFLVIIHQLVGVLPIRLDKTGACWEPDEDGQLAYITPLRIDRHETALSLDPWATARFGALADLIAWDPRAPQSWALRAGDSQWLGSIPWGEPFPALLRVSPLSWLKADCDGLVLLTRDPVEVRAILGDFEHGIQAESEMLTTELKKLVATPVANPPRILTHRGGGPRPDYGPSSNRRRQAEAHWGTDYTPLRAEGDD
jgi:hypothetical protein